MINVVNIVLDPGHGGWDPGTTAGGLSEKHYQLELALRIRERLNARFADVNVIMTRTTDAPAHPDSAVTGLGTELQARCDVANALPQSLLLSLHHDAAGTTSGAEGGTLYVYGPRSWLPALAAFGTPNHEAPLSYLAASRMLPIFRDALKKYGMGCNGIKTGDFQVLRNTKGKAVLIEGFFATNPQDVRQAKRPEFQADMVEAYVRMIGAALCLQSVPDGPPATESWRWPKIKVVLTDGRTLWGEGRNAVGYMPLPGTDHWVPIRAMAEVMGRKVVWTDTPPTATIV